MGQQTTASYGALVCHYLIGIPLSCLFALKLGYGVLGLHIGSGAAVFAQSICYKLILHRTDWQKVTDEASNRIKKEDARCKSIVTDSGSTPHCDDYIKV